jgi:hypothetical protein
MERLPLKIPDVSGHTEQDECHEGREHEDQSKLLRARRHHWVRPGSSL